MRSCPPDSPRPVPDLLDLALRAARAGGDAVLAYYGRPLTVDVKADDSPLTQADLASHRTIAAALAESGIPVLSEESPPAEVAGRSGWERFWCVDPLDGTKEFVKGSPADGSAPVTSGEFTVNVALVDRRLEPVLGVVHVPVHGVTYLGQKAVGRGSRPAAPRRPRSRRAPANAEGALTVVASRDHAGAGGGRRFCRKPEGRGPGRSVDLTSDGLVAQVLPRRRRRGRPLPAHHVPTIRVGHGGGAGRGGGGRRAASPRSTASACATTKPCCCNPSVICLGRRLRLAGAPRRRWLEHAA